MSRVQKEGEPISHGTKLVGYVRKATGGRTIKITVDKKTFNLCDSYKTADGEHEMVRLDVNLDKMRGVIDGEREVTSVIQVEGGE